MGFNNKSGTIYQRIYRTKITNRGVLKLWQIKQVMLNKI